MTEGIEMAREKTSFEHAGTADCDYCHGRNSNNQQVVHILSRTSREALDAHLKMIDVTPFTREFFLTLWDNAHAFYGSLSLARREPLALIYLEEHGVKLNKRLDWITKYREKWRI